MHEAYVLRSLFQIKRGPLGGGTYFVIQEGGWNITCGMIDGSTEAEVNPPEMGEPASFALRLTGPPGFADLFTKGTHE